MKIMDPKLRRPITLLIASLLIGSLVFHYSLQSRLTAAARLISEESLAAEAARSVREAPARLIQDQAEASLHETIRNSGFIGAENRAGWITALGEARTLLNLNSLSWHLSPQTPSQLAPNLRLSKMSFSATPLNPASLNRLIAHLRANAPGRFTIESCSLILEGEGSSQTQNRSQDQNGQATCHLNWWTFTPNAN